MNKKEDFKGIMVSLLVLSFITGFLVGVFSFCYRSDNLMSNNTLEKIKKVFKKFKKKNRYFQNSFWSATFYG